MIYITGDIHIPSSDIQKLNTKRFPEQKFLSKEDYMIICGDFGGIWNGSSEERYWVRWLSDKNFTTLFIDGNHETFDVLNGYNECCLCGGKVHKITEKVYHLMRGQIFDICGKKIFTLGGAGSHDKECRKEGRSWWKEELPSQEQLCIATKTLSCNDNRVDIVISHCAPTSLQQIIAPEYAPDCLTEYFEKLKQSVSYDKWFFGHYHKDCEIDSKHIAVFDKIIKIC